MRPLAQVHEQFSLPPLSFSYSFSLPRVSFSHIGPATLPTTIRHSIYIWIKLLHATPDGLRGSRGSREPREVSIE